MQEFLTNYPWVILLAAIWTLPWKGVALWKAASMRSKTWFVILFLINTLGILEILYIFLFSKSQRKGDNGASGDPRTIDSNKLNKMKMGL
jgi:methionyl-tRNA synthetase